MSGVWPTLCISDWETLPGSTLCCGQVLGPEFLLPALYLLPVLLEAEASLAHRLWHGLFTAVPCLGGHRHAELALGVVRYPFSPQGLQSGEAWTGNSQGCPAEVFSSYPLWCRGMQGWGRG